MANGNIEDHHISSSSHYDPAVHAYYGRSEHCCSFVTYLCPSVPWHVKRNDGTMGAFNLIMIIEFIIIMPILVNFTFILINYFPLIV